MLNFAKLFILLLVILSCKKVEQASAAKVSKDTPFDVVNLAEVESKFCEDATVRTIEDMPKDHGDPGRGIFPYKYQYVAGETDATVIVLPGGPGGTFIGSAYGKYGLSRLSKIYIDPRGVGCNFVGRGSFSLSQLTTEQHARDVLRVIQQLQLKKYFIYGSSYGTLVGTVLGFFAQQSVYVPQGVILEGVVGRAMQGEEHQPFERPFAKVVEQVPQVKGFLAQDQPLDLDPEIWNTYVTRLLSFSWPILAGEFEKLFAALAAKNQEEIENLRKHIKSTGTKAKRVMGQETFYMAVGCQEWLPHPKYRTDLIKGAFKPVPLPCLENIERKPYDSINYQLTVPIYYFVGTMDPATPLESAKYHYYGQVNSPKKVWFVVEDGSHSVLSSQLTRCSPKIWDRIVDGTLEPFKCDAPSLTSEEMSAEDLRFLDW